MRTDFKMKSNASMKKVINTCCVIVGVISFVIGAIGVVLPILPTTPFLIVAAFLFAKGSTRFHTWLLSTKLYQRHIDRIVTKKEMTVSAKISVLATISLMLLIAYTVVPIWHAKALIIVVLVFHYYYFLFYIKTMKMNKEIKDKKDE